MKQKTNLKGISLIVLVITIIIMIILAGAIILSLSKDNVIAKAKLGKESTDFTGIREMVDLAKSDAFYPGATAFTADKVTIPSTYSNEISVTNEGTIIIKGVAPGTTSKITDMQSAIEKLGAVYIPYGFTASSVTGEMSKEEGLVIYEGSVSNPDQTTVNQFVWVPVENYTGFKRESFENSTSKWWSGIYAASYATKTGNLLEVEPIVNYTGSDVTQLEVNAMYDSVNRYKGFYISRYEGASSNGATTGTVISKKNKTAWVYVEWGASGTDINGLAGIVNTTGAVGKSRAMYSASTSVQSTLTYGVQWDSIVRWYNSSGINIKDGQGVASAKNIYNIAGSVREWTMEAYSTNERIRRGGGSGYPSAAYRGSDGAYMNNYDNIGFRPALYIK